MSFLYKYIYKHFFYDEIRGNREREREENNFLMEKKKKIATTTKTTNK